MATTLFRGERAGKLVDNWHGALVETAETFAMHSRHLKDVDTTLLQQRADVGVIQNELCGLSALQCRLKVQIEMLENHQADIDKYLQILEGDASDLARYSSSSMRQIDGDGLLSFAENVSVHIKDTCGQIQNIHSTFADSQSSVDETGSFSNYVQLLNQQLRTLRSLRDKLDAFYIKNII